MKVHEASFQTSHTDVNDDKKDKSVCTDFLNTEGGGEENGRVHPKREETETVMIAKDNSQIYNCDQRYSEMKSMLATQIAHKTEQLITKIIPFWLDSLHDPLQCVRKEARTGVRSVVYNVVKQVLFEVWHGEVYTRCLTYSSRNISKSAIPRTRLVRNYNP